MVHEEQCLSAHGAFIRYLYGIKKRDSDKCDEVDDVKHTLFECPQWEVTRTAINIDVGTNMTPDNIISLMLTFGERWH